MREVHPEFDPETGRWHADEYQVDAATIRELIGKLPPRTRIKDYYPRGNFRAPPWPKRVVRAVTIVPEIKREKPQPTAQAPQRQYDHEEILNAWAAGESGPTISRRLGLKSLTTAAQIVADHRERGDPRAVRRGRGSKSGVLLSD